MPGVEERELGSHHLGSGPVISRGSTLHPRVFELLHDAAEAEGLPFTIEASARATGTDADAVHVSRGGIPSGLSACRCATCTRAVETVELADVDAAARLIAAFCRRLEPGTDFER